MKLAILATHPIQYHSPVFRELATRPEVEVRAFYGWQGTANSIDHGFGQAITWDVPLLDGYDYEFVDNVAKDPGTHHFNGIDLPNLTDRIVQWGAEALLVFGWSYKAHLRAMRYFNRRIPVLFRGDSNLLDEKPGLKRLLRRWYLRNVYKNVEIALAVGTNNIAYFRALGLRSDQIVLAPHAIDNARFQSNEVEKTRKATELRQGLQIDDDAVVVMYVGKLEPKKAPELLLSAFQNVSGNIHLVYVGSGELENALKSQASERVHFLGFQNQQAMETAYRIADVVVLPSRGPGETWGLALNEAMACGRAVIASSRVGGAVDLIESNVNGWMFTSENVEELKQLLQKCVALGRSGLTSMGAASLRKIQSFSVPRLADAIVQGVTRVANRT